MAYPPFCTLSCEAEYRLRFEQHYCRGPVITFDGVEVRFRKRDFDHAFFESSKRNGIKDVFSFNRAKRIDWIRLALEDDSADLLVGWDSRKKRYDSKRRVCLVSGNYVVVLAIKGVLKADFVTAFVADTLYTLKKIKMAPKWTSPTK